MTPSSRLLPNRALLHRTKSFGSRISNEKALTFTVRPYPTSTTIAMSNKNSPESPMVSQDFFNYTSGRWIYNEKQQLDARRIDFSVDGLKKVASNLALNVSDESFEMIKLREGLFNRAFLLSNKDGTEVIARLPTTLAGPKRLTMASEVATMKLLKAIGFPVPTVFSYSCCEENDVGSEYILMERAEGIPLSSVWAKMGRKRRGQVVTQLIELDAKLLALNLSGYGSIYMNGDLPESSVIPLSTDPSLCNYRLGPSVERSWWAEERKTMAIGRGPCKTSMFSTNRRDATHRCFSSKGHSRNFVDRILCTTSLYRRRLPTIRVARRPTRTHRSPPTVSNSCPSASQERRIRTTRAAPYGPPSCQYIYQIRKTAFDNCNH
jgi:hypothetical protein